MYIQTGRRSDGLKVAQNEIILSAGHVDCIINKQQIHPDGSLYLTQKFIVFVSNENEDYSISIDYNALDVHAICHSQDIYKKQCIYCQLSDPLNGTESESFTTPGRSVIYQEEIDENYGNQEEAAIGEILFAPDDITLLNIIFEQLSNLQSQATEMNEDELYDSGNDIAFNCNVEAFLQSLGRNNDFE